MNKFKIFLVMLTFLLTLGFMLAGCDTGGEGDNNEPSVMAYQVTFNANGGSGTTPAAQTINAGSGIALPNGSGLTRTGYLFGGWNTNADGTGTNYSAGSSYTVTGNITLYARWDSVTVTTYTVTYDINGGTGTTPAAQTVNAGNSITLPSGSGLIRIGFAFFGWNTNAAGTGTNYSAGSSYTPSAHTTLYAKWQQSIPNTPTGISALATSSSSITVSWTAVYNADGYYVYHSSSSSGIYTRVGTLSTTSYTNTGLYANTTYYYKVSAYNSTGESPQSSYISATTPTPTPISYSVSGTYYFTYNGSSLASYYYSFSNGSCTSQTPVFGHRSGTYIVSGSSITISWMSSINKETLTIIDSRTISNGSSEFVKNPSNLVR